MSPQSLPLLRLPLPPIRTVPGGVNVLGRVKLREQISKLWGGRAAPVGTHAPHGELVWTTTDHRHAQCKEEGSQRRQGREAEEPMPLILPLACHGRSDLLDNTDVTSSSITQPVADNTNSNSSTQTPTDPI